MRAFEEALAVAQLCDFVVVPDKPKDWHLYFLRELIVQVSDEKPTDRRYQKWLRERKVFDRRFIAFCERLLGIERAPDRPPALGEVGTDLRDALEKAKKKAEEEAEAARKAREKRPGRDAPPPGRRAQPAAMDPEADLDEDKAFAEKTPEAALADDAFHVALLERLFELNGYLAKFVFRELGEDFLAVGELYRRISTSAYVGRRPALPQFETWIRWQEWLGGLQKVGFRHRGTARGKEHGKFYKEVPDGELLAPSREDELAPVAAPAEAAPAGPVLVANAPTGRRTLEASGEEEDAEPGEAAAEEGLDLPPETAPPEPVDRFWAVRPHDDAAAARGPLPDAVVATPAPGPPRDLGAVLKGLTAEAKAIAEAAPAPMAPPPPPSPAPAPARRDTAGDPRARVAGSLLAWWREAGRPGERLTACEAGIDLSVYRGPHRGLLPFKLLALGAFAELDRAGAAAFHRELGAGHAFEQLFVEEAPLERVAEALLDPARPLGPCAGRLIHLVRFRRALKRPGVLDRLDAAADGRELARALRREVTGDALATGVLLAVREMARAGHWRAPGIDALACVPWRDVRVAAHRQGLLDAPVATTFEGLLAAAERLSRSFGHADEGEVPLLASATGPTFFLAPGEGDLP